MTPKISIIIPVYNTAPYLERCLESVRRQTLGDIEILCVNDASQDDSLAILRNHARIDPRIAVIDLKENLGAAGARNTALEKAAGEYIGFVDSDDYIDSHYFASLYAAAVNEHADIAKCNRKTVEINGDIFLMKRNSEIKKNKFFFHKGFTTAIYKNTMLQKNGVAFPYGMTNHEDGVFLMKAVYWANAVATVDDAWYYCEKRAESSSWRIPHEKRLLSCFSAAVLIVDFLNTHSLDKESYTFLAMRELTSLYRQGYNKKSKDAVHYCFALFSQCKYKNDLLAMLPVRFAGSLKHNDTSDFYSGKNISGYWLHSLRENVRKSMS